MNSKDNNSGNSRLFDFASIISKIEIVDIPAIATLLTALFIPAFNSNVWGIRVRWGSIISGCWNSRIESSIAMCFFLLTVIPIVYFVMRQSSELKSKAFIPFVIGTVMAIIFWFVPADEIRLSAMYSGFGIYALFSAVCVVLHYVRNSKWFLPFINSSFAIAAFLSFFGMPFISSHNVQLSGHYILYSLLESGEFSPWVLIFTICPWISVFFNFQLLNKAGFLISTAVMFFPWLIFLFDHPYKPGFTIGMICYLIFVAVSLVSALCIKSPGKLGK